MKSFKVLVILNFWLLCSPAKNVTVKNIIFDKWRLENAQTPVIFQYCHR